VTPKVIISIPKSVHDNPNCNGSILLQIEGVKIVIQLHICYKILFDSTNTLMYSFSQYNKSKLVFLISVKFTLDLTDQYNILNISKLPTEKKFSF